MYNKRYVKKKAKEGLTLMGTGIGLGALASVDSTGTASKISGAMPIVGSVYGAGLVMDGVDMLNKKIKKMKY